MVSVVVPTRDRLHGLSLCLEALRSQRLPPALVLELVVVDDGSVDRERVAALAEKAAAQLVRLDGRGPAAARNEGVRAARGDIVLMTDDDCIPEPGWAAALAAGVLAHHGQPVGGATVPADPSSALAAAGELIAAHVARTAGFLTTNNVGVDRELALRVPFDERFGAAAGEDRDWCARLRATGAELARRPEAVVRHAVETGISPFVERHYRYGVAARRLGRASAASGSTREFYGSLIGAASAQGPRVACAVGAAQLVTAAGYVHALVRTQGR